VAIEFDVTPEMAGHAQATGWIDAKVEALRLMVVEQRLLPKPDLNNYEVLHWQRKFMAHYGKVLGALETLGTFGIMPWTEVQAIEQKVKFMIQGQMGILISTGGGTPT